jgi:hypothetical protein
MHKFMYLKYGLSGVLVFVGAKMMLIDVYKIPTAVSLGRDRDADRRLHRGLVLGGAQGRAGGRGHAGNTASPRRRARRREVRECVSAWSA